MFSPKHDILQIIHFNVRSSARTVTKNTILAQSQKSNTF